MDASLLTIACFFARTIAPTAIVTVKTAGKATGIAATVRTRVNLKISGIFSCLYNAVKIIITAIIIVVKIR